MEEKTQDTIEHRIINLLLILVSKFFFFFPIFFSYIFESLKFKGVTTQFIT